MTDEHAICRHCGKQITHLLQVLGMWPDYHYLAKRWMHTDDGPDAYQYCGDEFGTDAEPEEEL